VLGSATLLALPACEHDPTGPTSTEVAEDRLNEILQGSIAPLIDFVEFAVARVASEDDCGFDTAALCSSGAVTCSADSLHPTQLQFDDCSAAQAAEPLTIDGRLWWYQDGETLNMDLDLRVKGSEDISGTLRLTEPGCTIRGYLGIGDGEDDLSGEIMQCAGDDGPRSDSRLSIDLVDTAAGKFSIEVDFNGTSHAIANGKRWKYEQIFDCDLDLDALLATCRGSPWS
jgi:hypothetical protein